jgi:succinyl-CoA synthetase alpha subunit
MSILVDENTRVIVQGITGRMAQIVATDLVKYGTTVVGGVSPGRGGQSIEGLPVFDYVADAVAATGANTTLVFVPPEGAAGALDEAIDAGIPLIVYPGDGLPIAEAARVRRRFAPGQTMVGPNSPGLISPGKSKVGFMPSQCYMPGSLGVISKSGSLSYEVSLRLTESGIGQSTVVGVGGDPVKGLTIAEALQLFHDDDETSAVLFLGEIGGLDEYTICDYLERADAKPITAFISGSAAPAGRKMGHASAIIGGPRETHAAKTSALAEAGASVAMSLQEITALVRPNASIR